MKTAPLSQSVGKLLGALGQPVRVQILLAIGESEACVCHLEALLNKRQAYISQHLMALRKANVLTSRRQGKYIYYRLSKPEYLQLIRTTADLSGISAPITLPLSGSASCNCPHCEEEQPPSGA